MVFEAAHIGHPVLFEWGFNRPDALADIDRHSGE